MSINYPKNSLLGLPDELWNHIQPFAGWGAMVTLGSTCKTAQNSFNTLENSSAKDFTIFKLFQLILRERHARAVEQVANPLTHLKKLGNAYTGEPISAIKLPCHDRSPVIHQIFVQRNHPFQVVEDKLENCTYVWQKVGITFAKCQGLNSVSPVWEEINLGRQIRGFDFFGPKLLVIATVQSLLFLDRKTFKVLKEYPDFFNIQGIEAHFETETLKIAEKTTITKLTFSDSEIRSEIAFLPRQLRTVIKKVCFLIKNILENIFRVPSLLDLGKTFAFNFAFISPFACLFASSYAALMTVSTWNLVQIVIKISLLLSSLYTFLRLTAQITYNGWIQIDYI